MQVLLKKKSNIISIQPYLDRAAKKKMADFLWLDVAYDIDQYALLLEHEAKPWIEYPNHLPTKEELVDKLVEKYSGVDFNNKNNDNNNGNNKARAKSKKTTDNITNR